MTKADEAFLEKLTEVIKSNISEPEFNVDILAEKMNMSRSSLHRKIKGIAQITPNEFIQLERLKMAAQLIQSQEYKINEVCYIVGFNSSSYFAKCFQNNSEYFPKTSGTSQRAITLPPSRKLLINKLIDNKQATSTPYPDRICTLLAPYQVWSGYKTETIKPC